MSFQELRRLKKTEGVQEIVLFGSAVKGKTRPRDIDVMVIAEKPIRLNLPSKYHAVQMSYEQLLKHTLFRTLLFEGKLLDGVAFSSKFGMCPKVIYWYDLKKLKRIDKSRFSHALFGRSGDGLLTKAKGTRMGNGTIMTPVDKDNEIMQFFLDWKISFKRRNILLG